MAVDSQAFIHLDTNRYSVPTDYASAALTLAADDQFVRLLNGDDEVARHRRCWGRKQVLEQPEHRQQLLAQRRGARDAKGRDRLRVEVPAIDELLDRWFERNHNLGSRVASTIRLLDAYGAAVLRDAVDEMLARDLVDIGALAVLCEGHRKRRGSATMPVLDIAPHVPERDVVPHDLGGYDE